MQAIATTETSFRRLRARWIYLVLTHGANTHMKNTMNANTTHSTLPTHIVNRLNGVRANRRSWQLRDQIEREIAPAIEAARTRHDVETLADNLTAPKRRVGRPVGSAGGQIGLVRANVRANHEAEAFSLGTISADAGE